MDYLLAKPLDITQGGEKNQAVAEKRDVLFKNTFVVLEKSFLGKVKTQGVVTVEINESTLNGT